MTLEPQRPSVDDPKGALERAWLWWTKARVLRWALAATVFLAGLVLGLLDVFDVCREQLAGVGSTAVVELCGPPKLTDLPIVAGALLAVVLLGPDLSEVSIGVIGLKQQVADQGRGQEKLKESQDSLRVQITELRNEVTLVATQEFSPQVTTTVSPTFETPDTAAIIREVGQLLESTGVSADEARERVLSMDPDEAKLSGELVHVIAKLHYLAGGERVWKEGVGEDGEPPPLKDASEHAIWVWEHGHSRAFPEVARLIASKDPSSVDEVRHRFAVVSVSQMADLVLVRTWLEAGWIQGVERAVEAAHTLAGYLILQLEALPDQPVGDGERDTDA